MRLAKFSLSPPFNWSDTICIRVLRSNSENKETHLDSGEINPSSYLCSDSSVRHDSHDLL